MTDAELVTHLQDGHYYSPDMFTDEFDGTQLRQLHNSEHSQPDTWHHTHP